MDRTARIDLAYDGTDFHGWQWQIGLRTVQGQLAVMLERLLGRPCMPPGAGRTDAGVHALRQTSHARGLGADEVARLMRVLPRFAPRDMQVLEVREVSPRFHARFSACWRRYEYHLDLRGDLFRRRYAWCPGEPLDRAAMDAACALFLGRRDCSSLCKTASLNPTNDCDVTDCRLEWAAGSAILHVRADRFLHHMVRTMTDVLVDVGAGRRRPEDVTAILEARDRRVAGGMAPAGGLYLADVGYPPELDDPDHVGDPAEKPTPEATP
ncbi:MAG: tRNA pseudouridine synthase A [Candidatus Latescibacteria bacterium]|nr:tRNA pseudouridine synthase A [Candidatus Latescibacterota bacterium]